MITQEEVLDLIKTFENELKKNNLEVEAISYANKDGLIYTHHYENPKERNVYSNSKSYVSVISGIAIDEKKISLDTTLADVLKDEINKENIEKAKQIRLKDLLTMSSGFNEAHLMDPVHNKCPEDWLNFALSFDLKKKPGEAFCYSNADTYMAARMVEKAYGRSLFEVMKEKLFDPLNMYVQKWD